MLENRASPQHQRLDNERLEQTSCHDFVHRMIHLLKWGTVNRNLERPSVRNRLDQTFGINALGIKTALLQLDPRLNS